MLEPSPEIGTLLRPFLSKFFCIFLENKCNSCTRKIVYTGRIIERRGKKEMRVVFERKSTTATGTINVMSPALRGAIFENIIIGPTLRDLHTLEYDS